MRISDWSSDVCSSDLQPPRIAIVTFKREPRPGSPLTACDLAPPPHAGAVSAVNEAVLFCQLGQMVRTAMLLQIGGGGADQVAVDSDAFADKAAVGVIGPRHTDIYANDPRIDHQSRPDQRKVTTVW